MTTRKKYTAKFKTKVVLEALKEQSTSSELAKKFNISPQQINTWKREATGSLETIFDKKQKSKKTEEEEREERLLKTIGQLKVEVDFLKGALR